MSNLPQDSYPVSPAAPPPLSASAMPAEATYIDSDIKPGSSADIALKGHLAEAVGYSDARIAVDFEAEFTAYKELQHEEQRQRLWDEQQALCEDESQRIWDEHRRQREHVRHLEQLRVKDEEKRVYYDQLRPPDLLSYSEPDRQEQQVVCSRPNLSAPTSHQLPTPSHTNLDQETSGRLVGGEPPRRRPHSQQASDWHGYYHPAEQNLHQTHPPFPAVSPETRPQEKKNPSKASSSGGGSCGSSKEAEPAVSPPPGYPKPLPPNRGLPTVRKGAYVSKRVRKLVFSHGENLLSCEAVVRDARDNSKVFTLTPKLLSAHGRRTLFDAETRLPLVTIVSSKIAGSNEMMVEDAFAPPGAEPMLTLTRVSMGIGRGKGVKCCTPRQLRDPVLDRYSIRKPKPPPPALFGTPKANKCTLRITDAKANHVADVVRNTNSLKSIAKARSTYYINVSSGYDSALLAAICVCVNEMFS